MREKTTICKRIFLMFLVVWITFISVFGAYQKSVEAAEWVAGTIAAIGGAPILSALLIGGVVVAGGIAVYELSQTSAEDHRNFVDGIKNGFNEFVADQEKQIALEQDSSLTDQQAADRGVAAARDTINNFTDNAISVTRTTAKNLKTKTVEYWNKFCKEVSSVADNGLQNSGITENTVIKTSTIVYDGITGVSSTGYDNLGANLYNIGDKSYIYKGIGLYNNSGSFQYQEYQVNISNSSNSYYIPYIEFQVNDDDSIYYYLNQVIINKSNNTVGIGTIRSLYISSGFVALFGGVVPCINEILSHVQFKSIVYNYTSQNEISIRNDIKSRYSQMLSYNKIGESITVPSWKRTINNTLTNTHIGSSIRSGRRAKLQSGDYIGSTFVDDSIPLKKTALRVGDATTVGKVGWDIPQPDVWDDVFSGGRPFSDVVRDTGVVAVPSDDVSSYPTDTEVEFPTDTDVQDTDDVIDIPSDDEIDIDDEIEIPERPLPDIIEDQEGDFYPTEMDLTQLFPFCIPFDIIYLVEKFDVSGANAPVITLPLKYPNAIRGAMGSDRYVVTIDLADYVVVRDVIRVFLLLLFIAGLMKITRDLIRG